MGLLKISVRFDMLDDYSIHYFAPPPPRTLRYNQCVKFIGCGNYLEAVGFQRKDPFEKACRFRIQR